MNERRPHRDRYKLNNQFINAFNWLRVNKYIKTSAALAKALKVSPGLISAYMNMKRPISMEFALHFNDYLKRHKHNLEDFEKPYLLNQAKLAAGSVELIMGTQLTIIEASQQLILDKLVDINKQLLKLQKEVGELRTKKSLRRS